MSFEEKAPCDRSKTGFSADLSAASECFCNSNALNARNLSDPKAFSFEDMATIAAEITKIDKCLKSLRAMQNNVTQPLDMKTEGFTADEVIDPTLMNMLVVELCQQCASGDSAGVWNLLSGGVNPNSRDYDGQPLLHIAAMNGRLSVIQILLEYNADCTLKDKEDQTAYEIAMENGFLEVAQLLSEHMHHRNNNYSGVADVMDRAMSSSNVSNPTSLNQGKFSSVPQPMVGQLIVIMVGLPARGKSYVAKQILRYFQWNGLMCRIFSYQSYKPKETLDKVGGCTTTLELPEEVNVENKVIAGIAKDLVSFIIKNGDVAILDGTQITNSRRQALLHAIKETKRIHQNRVIFVEIVTNDKEVVKRNIHRARQMIPDPPEDFEEQYYAAIAKHEGLYRTLSSVTDSNLSYIRIEDNYLYALNMISGWMPTRLAYMLHNLNQSPQNLYLTRSGEYTDLISGRIGGNSRLTRRGRAYSAALIEFFNSEMKPDETLTIMASCYKRCSQTLHYFAKESEWQQDPPSYFPKDVKAAQFNYRIFYFPTLDDVNHGDCEGQLLNEIRKTMPSTLQGMRADPYNTMWPNGECIHQVFNTRLEPHIHDIQANSSPVLVLSHLPLLQGLYSYFVTKENQTVEPQNAYKINIPHESVVRIGVLGLDRVVEVVNLSKAVDRILSRSHQKEN